MRSEAIKLSRTPAAHAPEVIFKVLTAAATGIILLMLGIILLDILVGGMKVLSWEFISAAPGEMSVRPHPCAAPAPCPGSTRRSRR